MRTKHTCPENGRPAWLQLNARRVALAVGLATVLVLGSASIAQAYVSGDQLWARTGPSHALFYAVAAAPDGGVYAVGDTYAHSNPGKTLVVRRTKSGALKWSRVFAASDGSSAVLDKWGNVYVAAYLSIKGGTGYSLLKISPAGHLLWSRRCLGASGKGMLGRPGLGVRPSGTVYLSGMERQGLHTIVRKYSAAGTVKWTWRSVDAGLAPTGMGQSDLALDSAGNAYVSASADGTSLAVSSIDAFGKSRWKNLYAAPSLTRTTIAVGGDRVCATGSVYMFFGGAADVVVAGCQLDGTPVYDFTYGEPAHPQNTVSDLAVDAAGDAYLTGYAGTLSGGFSGTGGCLTMKLDPSGAVLWEKVFDTAYHASGSALAIDSAGTVFVTGDEDVGLRETILVASFDSAGVLRWQKTWNDARGGSDRSRAIALAGNMGLYVSGDYLINEYTAALIKYLP